MPRLFAVLPIALIVLVAACGGDEDAIRATDESPQGTASSVDAADDQAAPAENEPSPRPIEGQPADATLPEGYGAALLAIMEEVQREIDALDEQFEAAFSGEELTAAIFERGLPAALSSLFDQLFAAISRFSPQANQSIDRGIAQVQALEPPDRFTADHERFVAGLIEDRDLRRKAQGAADNGIASILFASVQDTQDLEDELEAALSPEFLVFVGPFFDDDDEEDDEEPNSNGPDPFGDGGPDLTTVPDELIIPGATLEIAFNIPVPGGNSVFAAILADAPSTAILDFYESAFPAFGISGDILRIDAENFPALLIGNDERGGAVLISDDEVPTSITLGYFVAE